MTELHHLPVLTLGTATPFSPALPKKDTSQFQHSRQRSEDPGKLLIFVSHELVPTCQIQSKCLVSAIEPLVPCSMYHSHLTCWLLFYSRRPFLKIFLIHPYFPFWQTTSLSKYSWHNLLIFESCLKAGLCSETLKILGTDQHTFLQIPQPLLLPKVPKMGEEVNPALVRSGAGRWDSSTNKKKVLFLSPFSLCLVRRPGSRSFTELVRHRDGKMWHQNSLQNLDTAPWLRTHSMLWPKLSSHPNPLDESITFSTRSLFFMLAWFSYPSLC